MRLIEEDISLQERAVALDKLDCQILVKTIIHYTSDMPLMSEEEIIRAEELLIQFSSIKREL
tara:strand:- start:349 stop:534 length:186 start_codon:yes stop_codon:yes gene_type:complete